MSKKPSTLPTKKPNPTSTSVIRQRPSKNFDELLKEHRKAVNKTHKNDYYIPLPSSFCPKSKSSRHHMRLRRRRMPKIPYFRQNRRFS